jgi:4-amino-4-deoxy-L-arabinose transferase-like glycosyltransferase
MPASSQRSLTTAATSSRPIALAAIVAAALLLFTGLGSTDLWAPDEPRYAAVAEELRSFRHGAAGLALLHLNGAVYDQKPPLYFWAAALAGIPSARVTEFAARLPSALSGLAMIWLLIHFGARVFTPRVGVLAGLLLLTAFEFAHRARRAQLDVMLTLFEWLAVVAFWRVQSGPPRMRDVALLHAALGAAVLTKGPVGVLVPLLAFSAFLALERRWSLLRTLLHPAALALSLGPSLVWLATALGLGPHDLFQDAVVTNLFGRFFTGTSHARPFYYFAYQFPINFLPWTLLWPLVFVAGTRGGLARAGCGERARSWRFLLCWIAVHFVFFSLSAGKRGLYMLPAFPAAALLCADSIAWALSRRTPSNPGGARSVAIAVAVVLVIELGVFVFGFRALDPEKSPRPVALAAAALTPPGEPIGLVSKESLVGGLHYYGERPVSLLAGPDSVAAFVARGGRVLVVPLSRLEQLGDASRFEERARFRSGRRALLVFTPAGGEDQPPPAESSRSVEDGSSGTSESTGGGAAGADAPGPKICRRIASRPAVSMPRVGAANAAHNRKTAEKFVIGELNIASAMGTSSRQSDDWPAATGCFAPLNTAASNTTSSM